MARMKRVKYNKTVSIRMEQDYYDLISKICDDVNYNLTDFIREAIDLNIEKYSNTKEDSININ